MSQPPNQQLNNPQGTNQQNFYQQQQPNYPLQQQQYYPPQNQYGFQQNSTQHHQQQSPSQQQSYPPQTQLYQTQPNQQQQQIHQQPPQSQQQQQQLQLQQQQQQIQLQQQQQQIQHQQQLQHQQQQQYQPQVQTQQQFNPQSQPTYPHQQFIQQQQQSQQLMQQQFQKMNKSNHQQASQAAQTQQQQQGQSQQQQQNTQQQQPQQQIHQGQQQKTIDPKVQLKNVYDKIPLQSLEESLSEICPQMGIMSLLQKYEQAIDQMAKKKRVELQESFIQPSNKIKQTMRILVYSEAENQSNDLQSDTLPTWKVTIKGKILEEFTQKGKPFSNYFKQVEIKLNKLQFPQQNEFQQTNKNNTDSHGFELLRQGNQDTEIEILLYPQNYPQKYKVLLKAQNQLNKNLQQILGLREATRSQILASFWEYIKLNNLQDKDNREYIIADENLKQIFHQERLQMGHLNMQLKLLLENPDPIRILHTITMTDTPDSSIKGYDILIEGETQFQPELMPFLASKVVTDDNTEKKSQRQEHPFMILNQKVKSYEKQIQKLTEQLKSHKMKYDMFKSYSNNPSLFLENILIQQNSYLEMINSENSWKGENPKNLKFLLKNQDIVEKQIRKYLEQKEENPLQQSVM